MSKKFASLVVGLSMVFALVAVVTPASAATVDELMAQIAQLQAQLTALKGTTAPAASATFTRDLSMGVRGDDVKALQEILIDGGYLNIATPTTYFGALTKAAVVKWQKEQGLPATGYFGAMSRAALASAGSTGTTTGTTGTTPTTGTVNDGTDGSATITVSSYVTTSQTLKKGDVKDILATRVQATAGAITVNRYDVHFSVKPWLLFNKLTLKDNTGKVIAEKTITSSADATEVTVGSDYMVRFDGVNYTVAAGTESHLIIGASVLSASDKITGQTVTVTVPTGSVRTVNGKGYTDTPAVTGATATLTMSSTGSVGDLNARISPSTPAKRNVVISTTATTPDVTLGVFSIKLMNQAGKINSLSVNILNDKNYSATTLVQNVRLYYGDKVYGASSLSAGGVAAFSNMDLRVDSTDTWKDITVKADVLASSTAFAASSTLDVSTVVGSDLNDNTITLSNASDAISNDTQFVIAGVSVTSAGVSSDPCSGTNGCATQGVKFTFTLNNVGNSDVFVSATPATFVATSTTGSAGSPASASSTITYVNAGDSLAADTATAYVIPAGSSRAFTLSGSVNNTNGTAGLRVFKISQINYGTSAGTPTGSFFNDTATTEIYTGTLAAS